jgi:hypothetical protein
MSLRIILSIRLSSFILLASLSSGTYVQGQVVTGIITDNRSVPIVGARACQVNSTNCSAADINGVFHLMMEQDKESRLNITCPGFNPAEATIDETTAFPLSITLIPMYIPDGVYVNEADSYSREGIIARSALSFDLIRTDFSEFSGLLGTYNTEVMEFVTVTGPEIGISFPRFYTGFGVGFGYGYEDDHDSLVINLNNTCYKLNLGYDLVNSARIRMTPMLSLRWLRYRLQNYPDERKVPLESYLQEREIDLRFNQTVAVAAMSLEYKLYDGNMGISDYWSVGIYGGYAMKLNRTPWIRSDGNRITTGRAIDLNPFTFGVSLSFYTTEKQ